MPKIRASKTVAQFLPWYPKMTTNSQVEDLYPLSPMQQGILFHALKDPESGMYVTQLCAELRGELDSKAFHRAWSEVVRRHAVLRTSFEWEGISEPLQVVEREVELEWIGQDWQEMSKEEQGERRERYLREDRVRGFDLGRAPLMRISLMQTGEHKYQLIWSHHHLLLDGWSVPLVLGEVLRLYEGFLVGQVMYPPNIRPYADYIRWLREQDLEEAEGFWRSLLSGFRVPTRLGVERVQERGGEGGGYESRRMKLSEEVTTGLDRLTQEHRLTLNTVIQGAWVYLLSCYSGQRDVVFGATNSGRPAELSGVEGMVGLFINTLPVRLQLQDTETVVESLQRLQGQQIEARHYGYSPLVEVHGWSDVPRAMPLFETIFVFENYPVDEALRPEFGGVHVDEFRVEEVNNYPLTAMVMRGERLTLQLSYDRGRFEAKTIERMLGHWEQLLKQMVGGPEKRIGELEVLGEEEREEILEEWNRTEEEYERELCIHELIERRSAEECGQAAVVCGVEEVSFTELEARANRLSRYLRGKGVGPEV